MDTKDTERPRIGLALAGGVVEGGCYEIGVLCALQDAVEGLDFTAMDVYVGVSAGALISAMLANGIAPRTLSRAVLSRADARLNIDPKILFTPALGEYARRVGMAPGAIARWLGRRLRRPLDLSVVGALWELSNLAPVGIFDSAPVERYLARAFAPPGRTNDFRALRAELRVVAVQLDSSAVVAFGGDETAHVPISRAVQASIAMPGLYCPVRIDGREYIDGVARRTLNASLALDRGTDLLFCINPIVPVDLTHPSRSGAPATSLTDAGLPSVLSQTFRTIIHSRMRTGFRNYAHTYPGADVILIEPEMGDDRMFFSNIFSFENRREVCEQAYASTRRHLLAQADEVEEKLAHRGLRLRREVLRDDARRLFDDAPAASTRREALADARTMLEELEAALERWERAA